MYKTSYLEKIARKSERFHAKYPKSPLKANCIFWLWNLVQLFRFERSMRPKSDNVCRIGFLLKGGVGDILVSLNYLQNFHRFFESTLDFDVYIKEKRGLCKTVQTLCHEQNFVKQVLPSSKLKRDYDLYIELVRYPNILYFNESKIRSLNLKLYQWCLTVDKFHSEIPSVYRHGTQGEFIGMRLSALQGHNRLRQADIGNVIDVESVFQPQIATNANETLAKFSLENKRFITIQRGVGGGERNISTRLWPLEHYEPLVGLIKERLPDVCIVQVGTEKNLSIKGVDEDLREKTSFEELMVLLRQASCHIDGECGLVHLRHFLQGGPSVVMFGPTNENFYGYTDNINMRSDACAGGCEWMTSTYNEKCPRGFSENKCLAELLPEEVFKQVIKVVA